MVVMGGLHWPFDRGLLKITVGCSSEPTAQSHSWSVGISEHSRDGTDVCVRSHPFKVLVFGLRNAQHSPGFQSRYTSR